MDPENFRQFLIRQRSQTSKYIDRIIADLREKTAKSSPEMQEHADASVDFFQKVSRTVDQFDIQNPDVASETDAIIHLTRATFPRR